MSFEAITDLVVKYLTGVGHLANLAEKAANVFKWWSKTPASDEENAFGDNMRDAAQGVWRSGLGRLDAALKKKEDDIVALRKEVNELRGELEGKKGAENERLANHAHRLDHLEALLPRNRPRNAGQSSAVDV
ncbi:hypothetical protein FNAPI_7026 [Fusarium napiforme]|uniref:Uncharacterized protein n=1 Tax=Fusarium napiforme TaxID=42672 RepID=A0A8H5JCW4_9HYPO|nr:hypothetical protein FNAPI_7026 [Fusarium napiforme]